MSSLILKTAAANKARDAHYVLIDGAYQRTLKLERAATNVMQYSEAITDAYWGKTRANTSPDGAVAPDGTTTMDLLYDDGTAANTHYLLKTLTGLTDNEPQSMSVYARDAGRLIKPTFVRKDGSERGAYFDLSDGTIGTTNSGVTANIEDYGGGLYRCMVTTDSIQSGGTTPQFRIYLADADNSTSYDGDGASGAYLWGCQLEVDAAFPTSYIATSGASASRAADLLYLPWPHKPQAMTIYVKFVERGAIGTASSRLFFLGNGPTHGSPYVELYRRTTNTYAFRHNNGTQDGWEDLAVASSVGQVVEICCQLAADGSVDATYSLAGGAITAGTPGGTTGSLAAAWAAEELYVGGYLTAVQANVDWRAFKVAPGVRSMVYMRGAP